MTLNELSSGALIRVARDARIINGYPALPGEFPHQVAITYNDDFICGGSIINTVLILTAAHCVVSSLFPHVFHFKVIAGLQNLTRFGVGEQTRKVKFIHAHKNYDDETFKNDIAILILREPLLYTPYIKNVTLPGKNEAFHGYATVSGWGITEEGHGSMHLRKVKVPIVSTNTCRNQYRNTKYTITEHMICMGDGGGDACKGDSGGAAICRRWDSTVVQCGIVSFGRGCARKETPGVYTRVANYIGWINSIGKKIVSKCGSLYSEDYFDGQKFEFSDAGQSVNLLDDLSSPAGAWPVTESIAVRHSCSMEICDQTYFHGECRTMKQGEYTSHDLNMTGIFSARCTCEKKCTCKDIDMKKSSCARAYLEGGCRTCHAPYFDLEETTRLSYAPLYFPEEYGEHVRALRIRSGCKLTIFSDSDSEEEDNNSMFTSEIVENFRGRIATYECNCDDIKFVPKPKPSIPEPDVSLIDIPTDFEGVLKLMNNESYSSHPGLKAALKSLQNGKSSKNVYILLLGSTGSGKTESIKALFNFPHIIRVDRSTTTEINEYRIPIPVNDLEVANSELRIIDTPGLGDTRGPVHDAAFMATLDSYLAEHEELSHRVPNVVLIVHKFSDNRFNSHGSAFVKMMRNIDSFRSRITDENYSNVALVLTHFCSEDRRTTRKPDVKLSKFKDAIKNFTNFPRSMIITVAENRAKENGLPKVDGHFKLPDNEYYPKNLMENLKFISERNGDTVGLGVLRTAFNDFDNVTVQIYNMLPINDGKVAIYLNIVRKGVFDWENTEVSQILGNAWNDKLDEKQKQKFPGSLANLQKTLNLRGINSKEGVPRTHKDIFDLLAKIKLEEIQRALLREALGIETPVFPTNTIAGYGYNVLRDTYLTTSPFVMDNLKPSEAGFRIPENLIVENVEQVNKEHFHLFDDNQKYMEYRLKNLGVTNKIPQDLFNVNKIYKSGCNIESIAFKNDSCFLSGVRDTRRFQFKLNSKLNFTETFKDDVIKLPFFDERNVEVVEAWQRFFMKYGTHVVGSVFVGGAIEIEVRSNRPCEDHLSQTIFDFIKFAEEMSFLITYEEIGNSTRRGNFREGIENRLKFIGGDMNYSTNDLTKMSMENAAKLLTNWKNSLNYNPSVLTTDMKLIPLAHIVRELGLGRNYSLQIERAASLFLNTNQVY